MKAATPIVTLILVLLAGCVSEMPVGQSDVGVTGSTTQTATFQLLPVVTRATPGARAYAMYSPDDSEKAERHWLAAEPIMDQADISTAWADTVEVSIAPCTRLVVGLNCAATARVHEFFAQHGPDSALGVVLNGRLHMLLEAQDERDKPRTPRRKLGLLLWELEEDEAQVLACGLLAGRSPTAIRNEIVTEELTRAMIDGNLDRLRKLLWAGASTEQRDRFGFTPLQRALVLWQHTELDMKPIAEVLVVAGADVNACDDNGWIPLLIALHPTYDPSVRFLGHASQEYGAKLESHFSTGLTPWGILHMADPEIRPSEAIVRWLSANGADFDAHIPRWGTVLSFAVYTGRSEAARLLIDQGADINRIHEVRGSPLRCALIWGQVGIAELLVAKGADVDAADRDGFRPLHLAVSYGHLSVVDLLLRRGADPNAKTISGQTPLHYAAYGCYATETENERRIVRRLIAAGARVGVRDGDGNTTEDILLERHVPPDEVKELLRSAKPAPDEPPPVPAKQ